MTLVEQLIEDAVAGRAIEKGWRPEFTRRFLKTNKFISHNRAVTFYWNDQFVARTVNHKGKKLKEFMDYWQRQVRNLNGQGYFTIENLD